MIEIEGVRFIDLDETERSLAPFSSKLPLVSLGPKQRDLFDFLSFRFDSFLAGALSVDGFSISSQKDIESLFYLRLDVTSFARIAVVLRIPEGKNAVAFKKELASLISPLKSNGNDEEEGQRKLQAALSALQKESVCYILVDGKESVNEAHWKDIRKALLLTPFLSIFWQGEGKKAEAKKEERKEAPIVRKKALAAPSSIPSFLKEGGSTIFFLSVFSLLYSLGLTCGIAFCNEKSYVYGSLSILVGVFCIFFFFEALSMLSSSVGRYGRSGSDFGLMGFIMCLATVLGGALGVIIYWLMAINGFLMEAKSFNALALLLACIGIHLLALSCFLSRPIGKAFSHIEKRFGLHF